MYGNSSCQTTNIKIQALTSEMIPNGIKIKGKILEAKTWTDKNGDNLLIISRYQPKTKTYPDSPGYITESAFLFINQYLLKGNYYDPIWSYQDSIVDCMTDFWIGPLENSTSITDLNSDKFTETTIVYSYICRGDVSPSKMKVVLHDRTNTYFLKGTMYLNYVAGELDSASFDCNLSNIESFKTADNFLKLKLQMGRYENEKDFIYSPKEFLEFARNKWKQFMNKDQFRDLNRTDK
jgi:hypothetical protein